MNKAKIRAVATAILNGTLATRKKNPLGYNQSTYRTDAWQKSDQSGHNCGTTACIAGHAAAMFSKIKPSSYGGKASEIAQTQFAIGSRIAGELFAGHPFGNIEVTPKQAALVLFNLAETGKVDWQAVRSLR